MKAQPSRLPSDLAASVLSAARGGDPQEVFSKDFGAGSVKGGAIPPDDAGGQVNANTLPVPASAVEPVEQAPVEVKDWSRKTYRLRPDQYSTLAALEALMSSENGRRITASELARQAFDLLFDRHQALLKRLRSARRPITDTQE